jgi:hypothetical protein
VQPDESLGLVDQIARRESHGALDTDTIRICGIPQRGKKAFSINVLWRRHQPQGIVPRPLPSHPNRELERSGRCATRQENGVEHV